MFTHRESCPPSEVRFFCRLLLRFLECFQFNTHMVESVLANRLIAPDAETRIWKRADKFVHGEFVENVRCEGFSYYQLLLSALNSFSWKSYYW